MKQRNYKCPVCGAPLEGEKCQYCGCVVYDFANIDLDHPSYIRIRWGDNILTMKARAAEAEINYNCDSCYVAYGKNGSKLFQLHNTPTVEVDLKLEAVVDGENLFTVRNIPSKGYRESWRDDIVEETDRVCSGS